MTLSALEQKLANTLNEITLRTVRGDIDTATIERAKEALLDVHRATSAANEPAAAPAPAAANDAAPEQAGVPFYGPAFPVTIRRPDGQVQQFSGPSLRLAVAAELFSRSGSDYRTLSIDDACLKAVRQADALIRAADTVPAETGEWKDGTSTTDGYARQIAERLHERLHPSDTEWKPLPDILGLLTQIDNLVAGLTQRYGAAMRQVAVLAPKPRAKRAAAAATKAPAKKKAKK